MEANQTPTNTPEQHSVLIDSIAKYMLGMIHSIVDQRVNQIFEAHATVKQLDEQWEERIKGFVAEALDEHEADYDHYDMDDIRNEVRTQIEHTDFDSQVKTAVQDILSDGDYATEERVTEMIDEADLSDQIREALRGLL